MMKVTYFALKSFDEYQPGDLIPHAGDWPFISGYVSEGKIAPVLVCTLPDDLQDAVEAWEAAQADPDEAADVFIGERVEDTEDEEAEDEEDEGYGGFTIPELKAELDNRGVEYLASAHKADLIAALEADDEDDAADDDDE